MSVANFLDQVATRVAELGNGTITERSGNYSSFMMQKDRMREYARKEQFRLKQEIKRQTSIAGQLKATNKISAWKSRVKTVQRLQKELTVGVKEMRERHHLYRTAAPKVSFNSINHMSAEIAVAKGLTKYFDKFCLFSNVNFLIKRGEKIGIIGPNGCGKTTLINILLGKDEGFEGIANLGEWVRYGYLGQIIEFENKERTILEELLATKEMPENDARNYLARFQFYGDEVDKKIEVLSGGEKVRLYLSCLMLENPDCLIMDEPTNHLDVSARDALESALLNFNGTVIAISHDRYFLNRCVNRIFEICDGTLKIYNGNYEDFKKIKSEEQALKQMLKQVQEQKDTQKPKQNAIHSKSRNNSGQMEELSGKGKDIKEIEKSIIELEEKRKELEETFGADTPPEKYVEYDELVKEIEHLYELYTDSSDV
jgi:ATP-binding cassette subfamily F protein 3